jgi:hypothetical protein
MRLRFKGGPWDGVEFDSPICPDAIHFRHLDSDIDHDWNMRFAVRNHHQYLFDQPRILDVELKVGVNMKREPENGKPSSTL